MAGLCSSPDATGGSGATGGLICAPASLVAGPEGSVIQPERPPGLKFADGEDIDMDGLSARASSVVMPDTRLVDTKIMRTEEDNSNR